MGSVSIWLEATRSKTLPAAVAPVLLGSALAQAHAGFHLLPAAICLIFALLIQIGTNFANDYLDAARGTDTEARLGPRRAVASGLIRPAVMRGAAIAILALAFSLGLGLIYFGGWWLVLVGLASVVCAWIYTGGPYPLAYNGLGDVFVVLFFGVIAVACTYYVQTGVVLLEVVFLGIACGLVVNNILVVNNYRDIDEDRQAAKKTLVVLLGRSWALGQYAVSLIIPGAVLVWLVVSGYSPLVLLGVLPLVFGFRQLPLLMKAKQPKDFLTCLKGTALVVVGFSLFTSLGLVLA
ncbi:MAG: 1,4-dihydroxy-2-naphthoate polyprenyltransferase [Puniceicoccaceae bacterium]|nr:MAG: 1,4-dihydroxy-2-naphthoate polyprenyltransferase [Puniceicoccaceae bacterium]